MEKGEADVVMVEFFYFFYFLFFSSAWRKARLT